MTALPNMKLVVICFIRYWSIDTKLLIYIPPQLIIQITFL